MEADPPTGGAHPETSVRVHPFASFTTEKARRTTERHGDRTMLADRDLTNRIMGLAVELPCTIGPSLPMNGHATRLEDGLRHFIV
jgi:hypothetical protein